jgi:hypothetical protein
MPIKIHLDSIRTSLAKDRSTGSNKREASNPKLKLLFATLALFAAGFAAARQVASWPNRLRYPGELDPVEGRVLADTEMLRQGLPVYTPARPEKFNALIYGPLFYILGSRLINPQKPAYFPLRVVAMAGTLGLAAGFSVLAFWLTGSYLAAGLAPLIFLAYGFTTSFGVAVHSDSIALLLWYWGFLVAYRFRNSWGVLLAVPLMIMGGYYKAQFVAALLAVLLFLVLEKRFRQAAAFTALMVAGAVTLLLIFQFVTFRHQAFWLHSVTYNAIPFGLERVIPWVMFFGIIYGVPCLVALQFLRAYPNKLLACYFGWSVVLPALTIGKYGTSFNYSFELLLLVCPVFAAFLAKEIATPWRATLLLCLLGITLGVGGLFKAQNDPQPVDFAEDRAVQTYLRDNFRPHTPALGVFTGDLLRAGLDVPITDIYQYTWLVRTGVLPEEGLLAQFRSRRFQVILLNQDFRSETDPYQQDYMCVTEPLRQAIIQNYKLDASFAFRLVDKRHYYAWVPRQRAALELPGH